ncbi:hypothetical protein BCV70DRAFT_198227 [Testicularia cyperi]|uniref:THIF-type NAD/FAD binding fold domain-containing protein n=1 Tax=Testicularia cyperi TaxID=1882483 RepID=A0A317XUJ5_9BASI|nr:hypothetical protein BCV70DRAFT_198227 [Testicularia cyperi]
MSDSSSSSWLSSLSTPAGRNAIVIGSVALGSSLATAAAIFGTQRLTRKKKRQDLTDTVTKSAATQGSDRLQRLDLHLRDEASSSTDGGTPRYLSGIQSNTLRPASHLRNSTSFYSGAPQSPTFGATPRPESSRERKRQPTAEQWDESLIREQLSRNYSFLGDAGMDAIRNSFVIVVGAGGVGSWAALMLLRSGVSRLRLIDFDQVSLSSLNRHACATLEDVGRPKVVCCAEKFAQIAPWAKLEAWVELFRGDEAERLLGGNPTYVVDAIDNIDTKVDLLRFCAERKIKVISSMGAGAKSDPSRVQISDISVTSEDPLARSVRRRLRALGIPPIPPKEVEDRVKREAKEREEAENQTLKSKQPPSKAKSKNGKPAGKANGLNSDSVSKLDLDRTPMKAGQSNESNKADDQAPNKPRSLLPGTSNRSLASSPSPLASRNGSSTDLPSLSLGSNSTSQSRAGSSAFHPPKHSRRASSVSSFGSGVYGTPMTTPSDEMAAMLPGEGENSNESDSSLRPLDESYEQDGEQQQRSSPALGEDDTDTSLLADSTSTGRLGVNALDRRASQSTTTSEATAVDLSAHTGFKPPATLNSLRRHASEVEELSPSPSASSPALSRSASFKPSPSETPASISRSASTAPLPSPTPAEPGFFIPCVYSTEKSDTRLLPLDEEEFQKGNVDELAALEDFRVRILPVLGPLPAMFGLAVATYIICEIGGQQLEPLAFKGRRKMYEKMFHDLSVSESRHPVPGSAVAKPGDTTGPRHHIPFNLNDIAYLFEEVFRGRSIVPPFESLSSAQLVRWDSTLPLGFQNVVLLSRSQAKLHEAEVLKKGRSPVEVWGPETTAMMKRRMASERRSGFFRF